MTPVTSHPATAAPFTGAGLLPTVADAMTRSALRARFPVGPLLTVAAIAVAVGSVVSQVEGTTSGGSTDASAGTLTVLRWVVSLLLILMLMTFASIWGGQIARRVRDEERQVDAAELALRLGQFDPAAIAVSKALSMPMLSPLNRVRALGVYVGLLSRFGRYEDVAHAVEAVLADGVPVSMVAPLRAARVYAMLRDDRLVDADRALTELRRMSAGSWAGDQHGDDAMDDAGETLGARAKALAMLAEAYREVRTGHADDLLARHAQRRPVVVSHLASRVADLDAMVAWAALRMGDESRAEGLWKLATTLTPGEELVRRYPELSDVARRFWSAPIPPEATSSGVDARYALLMHATLSPLAYHSAGVAAGAGVSAGTGVAAGAGGGR
jgi:hypothetical protein